jgi:hypothetical protein
MPCGAFGLFAFSGRLDHNQARLAYLRKLRSQYPADHTWLLTNLGWACIEAGELDEGFEHARRSFALRPANGNVAHVLMHGHFERGDAAAGLAFIDAWLPNCPDDAMLFGHLRWHAGLCEIALGRADAALARHLHQVLRPLNAAPPLVGMTDAIALPWRLHLLGTVNCRGTGPPPTPNVTSARGATCLPNFTWPCWPRRKATRLGWIASASACRGSPTKAIPAQQSRCTGPLR